MRTGAAKNRKSRIAPGKAGASCVLPSWPMNDLRPAHRDTLFPPQTGAEKRMRPMTAAGKRQTQPHDLA